MNTFSLLISNNKASVFKNDILKMLMLVLNNINYCNNFFFTKSQNNDWTLDNPHLLLLLQNNMLNHPLK